ncbi:hypothetical protein NVP1233A_41 [Vibrio phage 1.233.A._10N.261.51.E6]|nr:hypothetical protein NVP1233A_41 [Vibrio phage 1.233.A._10N.261.51.E6]AUR96914.1 hypothetical protein NVP1233B_41 [Vibrio phage 1.233.B._10N.261.51.E6]
MMQLFHYYIHIPTRQGNNKMTNQLKEILEMIITKQNFFMIVECAESIGIELSSRSLPGMKLEVESLIANSEMKDESQTLLVTF